MKHLKRINPDHEKITQQSISNFIDTLETTDAIKSELKQITPSILQRNLKDIGFPNYPRKS